MNQPTLSPAVVPGRPRPAGIRAACLALLSWCVLPAALVHAAPIAPTTIGFDSISGAIGNYYNGGEGPNVGIESTFPAVGGWLDDLTNPTLNVPSGFTTGFAVVWNVRDGMRIRIFDDLDGAGTQLATQDFFGTSGTASLAFSGTAKSVRLERFGQPDFLGYDNLTFGSTTIGTPVNEPPAVTTSAATGVTSTTATLNATINPAGTATTAQFEYGTTPSYGSTVSISLSPDDGTTDQAVSANLSGLTASTTYYYRATGANGVGTRNGSGLTFTTAAPPGKALHFDGANDFVNIDAARSQVSGASTLTIEMWLKPGAFSGQPVLWSGGGGNYIQTDAAQNLYLIFNGIGQIRWQKANFFTPGVWQHVAMVFDGSLPDASRWKVYKDGALVTPTSAGGMSATIPALTGQMLLGQYSGGGSFYFPGAMDEVRIWNSARTQAEIQAFKDTEIASMPSCLIAYYKCNQGLANGANGGITTLTDSANATTENGTLNNFALTGTTSNWTDGSGIAETASAYAPGVPDINLKGGSPLATIPDGNTATGTANGTDFGSSLVGTGVPQTFTLENTGTSALTVSALSFSGANSGDYAVSGISLPATVAANGSTTFTVTFNPSAGGARTATLNVVNDDCDESNYDFALTGTGTVNTAPTVTRSLASITIPEGSAAANSGTFSDAQGNATVTVSASIGTITQDNGLGTWSWSYSATDGPEGPTTVTITATDSGAPPLSSTATFSLTVNNVAPKLNQCAPPSFTVVNTTIGGWAAAPGDLDGDGDLDIVMGYPGGGISPVPFRNNGNGTFTQMTTLPGAARVVLTPLIADFNGDGNLDIAVDQGNSYRVFFGNGALGSTSSVSVGSGGNEASGAVADLNADGKPDLIMGTNRGNSANDGNVSIRLNNGSGGFPTITQHLIGPGEIFVATADFNGDGKPDIAAADSEANTVTVLLNNGVGTFTAAPGGPLSVGTAPKQLTTGVVNNDGFQDIIAPNSGSGTVSVLLGNGTGGFAAATSYTAGAGAKFVLAADFNNDGVLDLGVALTSGVALLPANGGGAFGAPTAYGVGFNPINITLADMNADGGQDILVGFSDLVRYLRANVAPATVTVNEGSTAANSGTFCDPGADTVTITASLGTVTQNSGAGTWSWSYATADGPAQNTPVTITATDSDGASSAYTFNLVVANLNPTATFANGGAVSEGGTRSVTFSSPADAGAPDASAGFRYAYDFNNDGTFDSGDGTYAGSLASTTATVPATYLADGPGSRIVKGRILDKDGGFTDYTTTITINNVAPTIALTGSATVPRGTPYTLNLGAITDPGTDTVTAFSINWGEGNTENFTGNPASTTKTHTYATLGAKTITVTLTDEDGTFTGGTKSVTVENAAPVAGADGLNRPNTTKVAKVLKSDLLGNDSDADSDPLTLTAVGNAQPPGATVAIAGNFVVYTAPANNAGNGSFTYTLSAGAHTVTGTVTVTETSTSGGGGGTPNYLTLVPSGNDFVVTFLGVPGGSFRVQYSTAGPPNYDWQEFAPPAIYTAAPNGVFTHTDVNPPGPVRFYRAIANP